MSDLVFAFVSGGGLLALSIGAFGVLDAYNKRGVGEKRVDWLIGLYTLGVVMNIVAYVMLDRWYIAAPLALMLLPAERALEKRGTFKRRGAKVDAITGR
ncbi:hypothetical protein ABZS66_06455 [Dactylosporangium sp. NPDC005572]|uniref:hypothetical protein n=1 Tax=Dactylosporangium sp. NPDC005572 TaxID=3156889 RepID=UPI0033ACC47B